MLNCFFFSNTCIVYWLITLSRKHTHTTHKLTVKRLYAIYHGYVVIVPALVATSLLRIDLSHSIYLDSIPAHVIDRFYKLDHEALHASEIHMI